jgi:hypothetical protein
MKQIRVSRIQLTLLLGDIAALGIVTLVGFAAHDTLDTAGFHMLTTFLPLLAAWLLVAPFFSAYNLDKSGVVRQLWRPTWAMVVAAPMAGLLRSLWLGRYIVPVFVLVLAGFGALGVFTWRFLFYIWCTRKGKPDG